MKFKLQMVIYDDENNKSSVVEDIIELDKRDVEVGYNAGINLQESKQILESLQQKIVLKEAQSYIESHKQCTHCSKKLRIKGYHNLQYKTLFGTIVIPSPRLYACKNCGFDGGVETIQDIDGKIDYESEPQKSSNSKQNTSGASKSNKNDKNSSKALATKTFSPLKYWLPEHTSPELQYIESKWASYMSYDKTADLLQDVLPIHSSINSATVRNHLHKVAKRQEEELEDKPVCVSGCMNEWARLPKPDKPLIVGIDGGYVKGWKDRKNNFEVIVGKSFSKTKSPKRFGLVQAYDKKLPQIRLLDLLRKQGMQENQQITFLSDGADNIRDLQYIMHPEAEHILDWFHITKRITVLNQFAKGMAHSDPDDGAKMIKDLESIKWYLWHGNVKEALDHLEDCWLICEYEETKYQHKKKFQTYLDEITTYIENNSHLIPNYGERWRNKEYVASSFVESTVNEVVSKRMAKKQQMQWSQEGAHYMLQVRTAAMNDDLPEYFERWYPGLKLEKNKRPSSLIPNRRVARNQNNPLPPSHTKNNPQNKNTSKSSNKIMVA